MSLSSLKLASLLVAMGCLCAAASGCADYDDEGDRDVGVPADTTPTAPAQVAIETNATLTASPGQGVGVFVQYAAGGQWTITTSCDTLKSQYSCGFDLFVSGLRPSTALTDVKGTNLSDADSVDLGRDGTVHLSTQTSTDLQGLTFSAPPGAGIELEMYLDGAMVDANGDPQSRFVYWISDGVLHTGASTDPIDFTPTMN